MFKTWMDLWPIQFDASHVREMPPRDLNTEPQYLRQVPTFLHSAEGLHAITGEHHGASKCLQPWQEAAVFL